MAEIRLPKNLNKDTHNLGKTTLARVIDFAFLNSRNPGFFLFKHIEIFKDFVFFLELELDNSSYITIRRGVEESTKISFKRHHSRCQNFTDLPPNEWDHHDVAFDRAKELLDGILDWKVLKPWPFRRQLGYLLRIQSDYENVFTLRKSANGKHSSWKPFLAHILGFNAKQIEELYKKEEQLKNSESTATTVRKELGGSIEDISKIEGMLLLKKKEAEKKQAILDSFDFRGQDKERTKNLVNEIDARISALNNQRYSLSKNKKKILDSMKDERILFDPDEAYRLFKDAGIYFEGQIKKDFKQLINFNKLITEERRTYLQEDHAEIEVTLKQVNSELNILGKKRANALSFLNETDIFEKYKSLSDEIVITRADIVSLERQRGYLHRLKELRSEIRALKEECSHLQTSIESDVESQNSDQTSIFSTIRLYFSEIIEDVINRKALLNVFPNKEGHLEFKAEILDEAGNETSAASGHTYQKLLCIAFDLSVLRAHLCDKFPRFVYHDGVFESLDDRKKTNLLGVIRRYAQLGLQPIITLIDSDLPPTNIDNEHVFKESEIITVLHDENEQGLLFRINSW